jgi:hypothetical protein
MQMTSTDFLKLIAQNDFRIALEDDAPNGRLKTKSGKNVRLQNRLGYVRCPVDLPAGAFDGYVKADLIEQETARWYRLTKIGRARGLS